MDKLLGIELIKTERQRQVSQEGWSAEHDAQHREGELIDAAKAYIDIAWEYVAGDLYSDDQLQVPSNWPFEASWWKPSEDPIRNLVKAGALIAAEIDRISRLRATTALRGERP